jgi:hypothetical protein
MTRFPAEDLMVTAGRYQTATGPLPTLRETQSHLNRHAADGSREALATAAGDQKEG